MITLPPAVERFLLELLWAAAREIENYEMVVYDELEELSRHLLALDAADPWSERLCTVDEKWENRKRWAERSLRRLRSVP